MKKIIENLKEHGSRYFFGLYPLGGVILLIYLTIQGNLDILFGILVSILFFILTIIFFSPNKKYNYILAGIIFIAYGISVGINCINTCDTEYRYWELIPWSIGGFLIGLFLIGKYYDLGIYKYYKFLKKMIFSNFSIGLLKIAGGLLVIGIICLLSYGLIGIIAGLSATTIIIILLILILMKE